MTKEPNLFPLKFLVLSMGLVLIGGIVFVVAAIANKSGSQPPACDDVTVNMSKINMKGQVLNIVLLGKNIHITFSEPDKTTMVTVDRCTGIVQQKFAITP